MAIRVIQVQHILILKIPEQDPCEYQLEGNPTIGKRGNIVLPDFPEVSRIAATFVYMDPNKNRPEHHYVVFDGTPEGKLSTHGLWINGKKVKAAILNHNDELGFPYGIKANYFCTGESDDSEGTLS